MSNQHLKKPMLALELLKKLTIFYSAESAALHNAKFTALHGAAKLICNYPLLSLKLKDS